MPVEARAYPRPLPNPEWLGKLTEEILEPDLPIVDPHHHLWDHSGSRYLLDEPLAAVNSGHNMVATVFIQCGSGYRTSGAEEMHPIGESEFVRAIAEEIGAAAVPRFAPVSSASPICGCQTSTRCSKRRLLWLAAGFAASARSRHTTRRSSAPRHTCRRRG